MQHQSRDKFFHTQDGLRIYYQLNQPTAEHLTSIQPNTAINTDDVDTVLCLPGLTRNHRDFEALAKSLSSHLRVICPDTRGRGSSDYDLNPTNYHIQTYINDIWELLNTEDITEFAIIGTSMGGLMAMAMAEICPQRIQAVVLNDIGGFVPAAALQTIADYVGDATTQADWEHAIATVKSSNQDSFCDLNNEQWRAFTQRLYSEQADGTVRPDYDSALKQNIAVMDLDIWPQFENLKNIPTLLIRGQNSELLLEETANQMQLLKPDMQRITIANRGHAPFLDEPDAIAKIESFFNLGKPRNDIVN